MFTENMLTALAYERAATKAVRNAAEDRGDAGMAYSMCVRLERLCSAVDRLEARAERQAGE